MSNLPRIRLSGDVEGDYVVLQRRAGGVLRVAPQLSIGVGDDVDEAVRNGMSDQALFADYVGGGLDGFMDFEELKTHLHGVLEFSTDLVVENERPRLEVSLKTCTTTL